MKKSPILFGLVFSIAILLNAHTPQAASPTASTTKKAASSLTAAETSIKPQTGGILKVIVRTSASHFGYPPLITGGDKNYAPPFFDHLLSVGEDRKYKPALAQSWETSKDGKTITFKLRKGVTFHDGTPFNAQAVKSNIDNLIPPKTTILNGVTSVDVVDDYTVNINLSNYNNLILYQFASNLATYMYSPEALQKNGVDWAGTHPVGTGPFMLKDYQPNNSITLVKNPNYWGKDLPYLDGMEFKMISDPLTQMLTLKAGQVHAIFGAQSAASQLRADGYPLHNAPGPLYGMTFDTKNSAMLSNPKVRQAIEYAIDKEAICNGPGEGLYKPVYQIVSSDSPDYNKACPPRKYDLAKAKKLLTDAGYPNGFSFKIFVNDNTWKDGWVAIQSYLNGVGIKMEINYQNVTTYNLIRLQGKIEKGAAAFASYSSYSNTLFTFDSYWRSNTGVFGYVVIPTGVDELIEQAKLARNIKDINKFNNQIIKSIYDDETVVPLWQIPSIAVVGKSVQNTGWLLYSDTGGNEFVSKNWLKK